MRKPWTMLDIGGFLPLKGAPSPVGLTSPLLPAGDRGSLLFPSLMEVFVGCCSVASLCLFCFHFLFIFVMLIGEVIIIIGGNVEVLESGHGALSRQFRRYQ